MLMRLNSTLAIARPTRRAACSRPAWLRGCLFEQDVRAIRQSPTGTATHVCGPADRPTSNSGGYRAADPA